MYRSNWVRSQVILAGLAAAVLLCGCWPCPKPSRIEGSFPEMAGVDYQNSKLSIPILERGVTVETLEMDAYLKMSRVEPVRGSDNRRLFEFQIVEWEATGRSDLLGGNISLTLSKSTQPRSVCVSAQEDRDYPATLIYNAVFDVYLDDSIVLKNQVGLGIGSGVISIPPRVDVQFQKAFEFGGFEFAPGMCACVASVNRQQFDAAVTKIRSSRGM